MEARLDELRWRRLELKYQSILHSQNGENKMKKRLVEILVGLMFFFLIGLVFVCSSYADERKDTKTYFKYYALGQNQAMDDSRDGQLWKHYEHKMKETLKEQAFREGYLDKGSYYAMPLVNKIKYDFTHNEWLY
jgi:hypothetical protein